MALATYYIPSYNWATLQERIAKVNKRAVKLGLEPITLTKIGEEKRTVDDGIQKTVETIYTAELDGQTPMLAGWRFVATIQRLTADDGQMVTIFHAMPGAGEVPHVYRTAASACDHCHTARRRNDTYIVRSTSQDLDGEEWNTHKQVGSTCLADFLGGTDPHAMASLAEWLGKIADDCSRAEEDDFRDGSGRRGDMDWELGWFLARVAQMCRVSGFITRKAEKESPDYGPDHKTSTASDVVNWTLTNDSQTREWYEKTYGKYPSEIDTATAQAAIEWAERQTGDSDYIWNIQGIVRAGIASIRLAGLAASIVGCYLREQEKRQTAQMGDQFIGTPGERIEAITVTVRTIRGYSSQYGNGDRILFTDPQGNALVWFTTASHDYEEGQRRTIACTVKKHDTYNDHNQTVITRVGRPQEKRSTRTARKVKAA